MSKVLGYIFTPVHYFFFFLFLVIFQPIQWVCYRFVGYKAHKTAVDLLNFFLMSTYYLVGSQIKFVNYQFLPTDRPIIFASNHQGMYDIPVLIWYLRKHHAKFISKIELTKGIPSISFNLKYGGGANIDRKDSKQAVAEILKLGARMKEHNWSAVIFPEGTRSKNGMIKDFQVGGIATLLKKAPNALIVPIALNGVSKLLKFGKYPLSFGEKMTWEILEPIEPAGQPIEIIVKEAELAIRKNLNQYVQ